MSNRVAVMLSKMPEERQEGCAPYLQNISCLECSPYSAHIFEVEDGGEERPFPLLCRSYCEEAYMKCSSVGHKPVPLMRYFRLRPNNYGVANRPRTAEKQTADAKQFCSQVASDDTYCYPNVRNGPQINGIDTQSEGELGCFCGLPVATRLRNPIAAVHAGDGSGRLFIVEQVGVIKVLLANNTLLRKPFLYIRNSITVFADSIGGEPGLLGLAFHPNYKENGRFFVHYSAKPRSGRFVNANISRVSEFVVETDNPNRARRSSERVILSYQKPSVNHHGGELVFDEDGYLLIFIGDGEQRDPQNNALNRYGA